MIGKGTAKRPLPEQETRKRLLATAKKLNCEKDVLAIMDKYDRALLNCTNEEERKHIAHTGIVELHKFFYCHGNLVVDGIELLPADPGYEEIGGNKIKKL